VTTPRELPDELTPLTIGMVWNALLLRWETLGVEPKRAAIELKLAHIHLETGLHSCHCWNLGNIKHVDGDGRCWTLFACGEELPVKRLDSVVAMSPAHVRIVARYNRKGAPWASVHLTPPHPWCRFRAFESLDAGVDEQLSYLHRHPDVLAELQTGDPGRYAAALAKHGYFTANPKMYEYTLRQRLALVTTNTDELDWGDVT
jgi:hypothetical protein